MSLDLIVGDVRDDRCCGDHPGNLDTMARPGSGFCRACYERLMDLENAKADQR